MSDSLDSLDPADLWYNRRAPIPARLYPTARCSGPPPARLLLGIAQFNRREFFECHETLEDEWNAEPGPIRTLYKGILQVGVGCYHLLRGNYRGAELKLRTGCEYLGPFAPRCMDVEVGALIEQAERLRSAVIALGPERTAEVDRALLPQIAISSQLRES